MSLLLLVFRQYVHKPLTEIKKELPNMQEATLTIKSLFIQTMSLDIWQTI